MCDETGKGEVDVFLGEEAMPGRGARMFNLAIASRAMEAWVQCFLCLWLLSFLHLTHFPNVLLVSWLISVCVRSDSLALGAPE